MLRLANITSTKLFSEEVEIENLLHFNGAIRAVGAENFLGLERSMVDRILYEDDTLPRSTCPGCHGFIRPTDVFCGHCGAPLNETHCCHCGTTVRPGMKFCTQCGAPLLVLKVKSIEP